MRRPDEEERAQLEHAMRGVVPLDAKARVAPLGERTSQAAPAAAPAPFEVKDLSDRIEAKRQGLDARVLRRLREGDPAPSAQLDLHGLTEKQAQAELEAFLKKSAGSGLRCVLVIHGRGIHSAAGQPILKDQTVHWLTAGKQSQHILGFTTAQGRHGGQGALYVLLASRGSRDRGQ